MDIMKAVLQADQRIHGIVRQTPLLYSFPLSQLTGANVYLKLENLQTTGSYHVRGAFSKLLSLSPEERSKGVVSASTGNHGAAMAFAMNQLKTPGTLFLAKGSDKDKEAIIRQYDTEVRSFGFTSLDTERYAREYAEGTGLTYISHYNDDKVIGGNGTVGMEIVHQIKSVDALFCAVGAGGLISGVSGFLKGVFDRVDVIGCSPKAAPVMYEAVLNGGVTSIKTQPTIAENIAGHIDEHTVTFEFCCQLIDDHEVVSEKAIGDAMRLFMRRHHLMIEGSAGVALAGFLERKDRYKNKNVVIVICSANISMNLLSGLLSEP